MVLEAAEEQTAYMKNSIAHYFPVITDGAWLLAKSRIEVAAELASPGSNVRFATSDAKYLFFRVEGSDATILTGKYRPASPETVNSLTPEQLERWMRLICRLKDPQSVN